MSSAVVVAGLSITVATAWSNQSEANEHAIGMMTARASAVADAVRSAVAETGEDVQATAGLFMASDDVTFDEFNEFVRSVGPHEASIGLAYVPVVADGPESEAFRFTSTGERVPTGTRSEMVVRFFAPPAGPSVELIGFDVSSDPAWIDGIRRAERSRSVAFSAVTQLFGVPADWGFLAVAPILEQGAVTGFTVSINRLDGLIADQPTSDLDEVVWQITDITDRPAPAGSSDMLRRSETVTVGDRTWQVDVFPTEPTRRDLTSHSLVSDLAMGSLVTLLGALVVHLTADRLRSRRAADELKRLTQEKDEFLAAISHELRTPLTVVVGMAEILHETTAEAGPDLREHVSMLRQESQALARLVEDLLLVGRLEADVLAVAPEPVDVAWETKRVLAEDPPPSQVDLTVTGHGVAWTDPIRIRHLIRHLYSNAVRYGDGKVAINIGQHGHKVRITVSDNGPGVPDDQLNRLFAGARGTKDSSGSPRSLGLGLRVCARLAQALGGGLSHDRSNGWTHFTLELPVQPRAPGIDLRVSEGADAR